MFRKIMKIQKLKKSQVDRKETIDRQQICNIGFIIKLVYLHHLFTVVQMFKQILTARDYGGMSTNYCCLW